MTQLGHFNLRHTGSIILQNRRLLKTSICLSKQAILQQKMLILLTTYQIIFRAKNYKIFRMARNFHKF